jgi:hypothetical protein
MEDVKKYENKVKKIAISIADIATAHRFTLLFIILGAAIAFALLRTSSFIDIPRNEERYTTEALSISYKQIDEEVLNKFKEAGQDVSVEVGSQFDPDRTNPFSE